jgi:hypothetical protein
VSPAISAGGSGNQGGEATFVSDFFCAIAIESFE